MMLYNNDDLNDVPLRFSRTGTHVLPALVEPIFVSENIKVQKMNAKSRSPDQKMVVHKLTENTTASSSLPTHFFFRRNHQPLSTVLATSTSQIKYLVMYCTPNSLPSSPRRRVFSEASIESHWSLMGREDRELLLRDWQLERRQLQLENQRLTKLLDDAHKHIRLLRKQQSSDDGGLSVSSHAATVKAGSSHKLVEKTTPVTNSRRKRRMCLRLFCKEVERKQNKNHGVPVIDTPPSMDTTSCNAVCDARDDKSTIISGGVPKSLSKKKSISKAAICLLRPDDSFETEASSRAPSDERLAEF